MTPVVVLGFHRSGTSMVTRMLNLLGVDLGDEAALLAPEERDNARGYWEPRWMIELNDELLAVLGTSAFEPFRAESGWERSPTLDPLRERARTLLHEHFAERPQWGWKDPRTSLTLPFWRELVDAPLKCVVCVRSPADAVASALKRGVPGIDRWTYAVSWLDHVALPLATTTHEERLLVFYEDALRDPAGEARRVAAFLGVEQPSAAALEPIVASVDPELRHHRTNAWDVAIDPGLPLETRTLYLQLRARRLLEAPAADGAPAERIDEALEYVGALQRVTWRERGDADGRAAHATAELERLNERLAQREQELRSAGEQTALTAAACKRLEGEVAELRATLHARDAALTTILGSRTWRATRPLRALARRLRRD